MNLSSIASVTKTSLEFAREGCRVLICKTVQRSIIIISNGLQEVVAVLTRCK